MLVAGALLSLMSTLYIQQHKHNFATHKTTTLQHANATPATNTNTLSCAPQAKLAAEKAALEKELARLKAEKEALAKKEAAAATAGNGAAPKRGPFGLPFAFGGN